MNKCKICKTEFEPYHSTHKYCSVKCSKQAKQKRERKYMKIYRKTHKKYYSRARKKWYRLNKSKMLKYQKEYYKSNIAKIKKRVKEFNKIHKEIINKRRQNKLKNDIYFKLECILRDRLNKVLKTKSKSNHTFILLSCSVNFLKQHLEKQFQKGMNWKNYGTGWHGKGMREWHVDHIKPCASFDLSKPSEQKKCFHYTNLQPLWAKDNLRKSDKIC
jgi:signal recognition particle GTPase